MEKLCSYDGITLFIKGEEIRNHVQDLDHKYRLRREFDYSGRLTNFQGRYKNFDIWTAGNSRGSGIAIGGSFHKLFNNELHNYNTFYWSEFEHVYSELLNEFQFDPLQTDIWVLESGINNLIPNDLMYNASNIAESVIYINGKPKLTEQKYHPKGGFGVTMKKGRCAIKIYDKGRQYKLLDEIVRTECSCTRRKLIQLGFHTFNDLMDFKKHQAYSQFVYKKFQNLILFQPEIFDSSDLTNEEKLFLYEYSNGNAWTALRRNNPYKFKKTLEELQKFIDRHCSINLRRLLLNQMQTQIFG